MNNDAPREWLAACPRSLAPLLAQELRDLGATETREHASAVVFTATRAVMYRACLWSRVASRILLPVGEVAAGDADQLHAGIVAMPWEKLLGEGSFAVDFHGSNRELRNTRFGAQRVKDGILDRCRNAGSRLPVVDPQNPGIRISVRLRGRVADVALDMVGESLHRRGYRTGAGEAPLKENLAAAVLLRAGWPALIKEGGALIDPMCGSGTLLIEGALMALDHAPALHREHFGFMNWGGHDETQWRAVLADAKGRAERGLAGELPEIRGYDADPRVLNRARENIATAGLSKIVRVTVKPLEELRKPTHRPLPVGLVITNPPYGERLGDRKRLPALYSALGECLQREFEGWSAAVLAGDRELGKALGLRSHRQYEMLNGPLPVLLVLLQLTDNRFVAPAGDPWGAASTPDSSAPDSGSGQVALSGAQEADLSEGAAMFANRLRKNLRRLKPWLKKTQQQAYRLYDADMPEYNLAVDRYGDWLHVAEYRAPASVDADVAARRLHEAMTALAQVTDIPSGQIVLKARERQRGRQQYERRGRDAEELRIREGEATLLVNLHDYLDTGLFLDHRPLRRRIAEEAGGRRFLNLFCYTGSMTVQAAIGGATDSVSVDLSNTYLRWLERNLRANKIDTRRHRVERSDVLAWLRGNQEPFDLIVVDPPSFSNSTRVPGSFDVQRDHRGLIDLAMASLAPGGTLYFSNNRRKFRLAPEVSERYDCANVTEQTLDPDFIRRPAPHGCWRLRHRDKPQ